MGARSWVLPFVAVLVAACATGRGRFADVLDECRRDERGEVARVRYGSASRSIYQGVEWSESRTEDTVVTETRRDCVFEVVVETDRGPVERGGYAFVGPWAYAGRTNRVAFVALRPEGWLVVADGVEWPAYEGTWLDPRFSADGEHVIAIAATDVDRELERAGSVVLVDGVERMRTVGRADYGAYGFTSDGRWIVAFHRPGAIQVYVDGEPGPLCDREVLSSGTNIGFATSAVGGHFGYRCTRGGRSVLIVDGRELAPEPGWSVGDINFTGDGAHWWYRSMLLEPPEGPPSQSDPARIALVLDGEHHRLGLGAERIEQLVSLQGGLFGVVTEDRFAVSGTTVGRRSFRLLGVEPAADGPWSESAGSPALIVGDRVCPLSREVDPNGIERRQDGTVTYSGHVLGVGGH